MCNKAAEAGLITRMMRSPDFRVDYGTITSCHMLNPKWDKPIITISQTKHPLLLCRGDDRTGACSWKSLQRL